MDTPSWMNAYGDPPPPLIDVHGMPLRREPLTRELAAPRMGSVRTIAAGRPAEGLTPVRLAQILRSAESGDPVSYLELAEQMEEKNLHYLSVLGTRKRQVSQLPITVDAADSSDEAEADAQMLRDWLERDVLQMELFDLLDAIGKGYSFLEIIWDTNDGWMPSALKWRDPRWFRFNQVDGETPLLLNDAGVPEPLQPFKYIAHVHPAKSGLPVRGGLARPIAWAYLFTNYSVKDWIAFAEVYGQPLRVGKYAPGETEANIQLLERAVAAIGADAGAVIPTNMLIEFVRAEGTSANVEIWKGICEYFQDLISKAVLGQTNTTDAKAGGMGSGQANVHNDVREDIETADCVAVSATLNRDLVRPVVMLNRGPRKKYPRLRIGRADPVDVDSALKLIDNAVKNRIEVSKQTYRKMTGLAEPEDGDDLIQAAPETPPNNAGGTPGGPVPPKTGRTGFLGVLKAAEGAKEDRVAAAVSDAGSNPDAIDRALDEVLGDWERLVEPVLQPIEAAIAGAADLDEVKRILIDRAGELIEQMDVGQLREALAQAGFGAAMAGRLEEPGA